jgi:hypothetical protein
MSANNESLDQFSTNFQQQVIARVEAEDEGAFKEEKFVEIMNEYLAEAGEIEDAEVCLHKARGIQISGYALSENGESLDILVAIHTDAAPPQTVGKSEVIAAFKRALEFFKRACNGYHTEIEESSAVYDAAQQIYHARRSELTQVRFILITDGVIKNPPPLDKDLPEIRANFEIWDMERLYRLETSGRAREAIEIDFTEMIGGPIPCLIQPDTSPEYAAYLTIFPAKALVEIYGRYGSRLLERNVRSFLQARGQVNAGMRDTIRNEQCMFLAYNNGLSATAEKVTVEDLPGGGKALRTICDFQIVNGGQTTASIYHTVKKDKVDVSQLYVQVKLTVLNDPTQMDTVVPLISRYSNTQNKVQEADLRANDVYHRKLEEYSRSVWAPAKEGTQRQTHWFYERARGQYSNELLRAGTPAKIREFESLFPKSQMFNKTELAKVLVTWQLRPDIVSKGDQACFLWFMSNLDKIDKENGKLEKQGFERIIAKLIIYRSAQRIVKSKEMAFTAYWANIITYTVSRMVCETNNLLDMERIWKDQKISNVMEIEIKEIAKATYSHIIQPYGGANVTQYCKKQQCWSNFLDRAVSISPALKEETLSSINGIKSRGYADADNIAAQEMIKRVMQISPEQWFEIHTWAETNRALNKIQLEQIVTYAELAASKMTFTTRKANDAMNILNEVTVKGYHKRSS